jgi:Domain of unknown function (DUF4351)
VAIDELPRTQKTLWIRLLGRDQTQLTALQEVSKLPIDHPRRNKIIRLLAAWGVKIETGEIEGFVGQEIIMGFSQAFLDWEEETEQRGQRKGIEIGQRSLVIRLLARRVGILPVELRSQVEQLSLGQLESLSEALLDFSELTDLVNWLNHQESQIVD